MLEYSRYGYEPNALFDFGFNNFGAIDPDGIGIMTYGLVWPAPERWTPTNQEWGVTITTWTQMASESAVTLTTWSQQAGEANVTLTVWTQIDNY